MCPACIATAALVVAGGSSTGGLTALAIKKFRKNSTEKKNVLTKSTRAKEKEKPL